MNFRGKTSILLRKPHFWESVWNLGWIENHISTTDYIWTARPELYIIARLHPIRHYLGVTLLGWWVSSNCKTSAIEVRTLLKLKTRDSSIPYFVQYGILTLPPLYFIETCSFVRRLEGLFRMISRPHQFETTQGSNLYQTQITKTHIERGIHSMANMVPDHFPECNIETTNIPTNNFGNQFPNGKPKSVMPPFDHVVGFKPSLDTRGVMIPHVW